MKRAALVVLQGSDGDIGTHVLIDKPVTLGRDPAVELPLHDEGISRRHCKVSARETKFFLEDLGSTNGTRLNDTPIGRPTQLQPGDRVAVGSTIIEVRQ